MISPAPTVLRLGQHWPTQPELAQATRKELIGLARASHHGRPERFADRVAAALATPTRAVRSHLVRAKATGIDLAASQLLALHQARRSCEQRMTELLLGRPPTAP